MAAFRLLCAPPEWDWKFRPFCAPPLWLTLHSVKAFKGGTVLWVHVLRAPLHSRVCVPALIRSALDSVTRADAEQNSAAAPLKCCHIWREVTEAFWHAAPRLLSHGFNPAGFSGVSTWKAFSTQPLIRVENTSRKKWLSPARSKQWFFLLSNYSHVVGWKKKVPAGVAID